MYQGKFDKKRKGTTQDILEITAQRNAEAAAQKRSAAEKKQAAAAAKKENNGRTAAMVSIIVAIAESNSIK
mgnify:CR=1 FL=1